MRRESGGASAVAPATGATKSRASGRSPRPSSWKSGLVVLLIGGLAVAAVASASVRGPMEVHLQSLPLDGNVTAVRYSFLGPSSCGTSLTAGGFGLPAGGAIVTFPQALSYRGGPGEPATCTVHGVVVVTRGFTLVRTNVPLELSQGSVGWLNVTVATPPSYYSGPLDLDLNVSSP